MPNGARLPPADGGGGPGVAVERGTCFGGTKRRVGNTRILSLSACILAVTLGGCKRTSNGDVVIDRPSGVQTTPETLHVPSVGTRTDTINTPSVETQPETVIVNKPVLKNKKTVVKTPVIKP